MESKDFLKKSSSAGVLWGIFSQGQKPLRSKTKEGSIFNPEASDNFTAQDI